MVAALNFLLILRGSARVGRTGAPQAGQEPPENGCEHLAQTCIHRGLQEATAVAMVLSVDVSQLARSLVHEATWRALLRHGQRELAGVA
jgi:hypothetical protein